ncbi:MAG: Dephospho-CoA kinase [uncultured Acidimicrobiales bacterium]|uniref:Dephospho-CoA kinase n=1 Tax=uncultured Acidimicrobiales bacterium TaxID=310071 RepID=A0A6J4IAY4_9ACTN|nr:MAG: Dephospho-CoA kinase [uncultured Acidimicrobiales bacterium]
MIRIGLTGGIGSGKSTVSDLLAARGAVLIDADRIVREIQAPGGVAYQPIIDRFGPGVVAADGTLDRPALAAIVFADEAARKELMAITNPHVGRIMAERMAAEADTDNVVVLDIPLLAEGGKARYGVGGVVVVDCPIDTALRRLVDIRGMDEEDARRRMASQATREERVAVADFVVDNSGDLAHLTSEVERAWAWIQSLPAGGTPPD